MDTKTCRRCGREYPATSEFFTRRARGRSRDGLDGWCKRCHRQTSAAHYAANRERLNERRRPYWRDRYRRRQDHERLVRDPDPIALLTNEELAYMAGLVDGEGCLTVVVNPKAGPVMILAVNMTSRDVLQWLAAKWSVGCRLHSRATPRRKTTWKIQLTGARAALLCRRMLPWMRVKHRQAQVFRLFADSLQQGFDFKVSDHVVTYRLRLKAAISLLNRRGVPPTPEEEREFDDLWDAISVNRMDAH